jgi:hypothetical protein
MKRVMMLVCLATAVLSSTGCNSMNRSCCGDVGCRPCAMGWQRGGTDYQRFLGGPGCNSCQKGCQSGCNTCGKGGGLGSRLASAGHGQYANAQPAGAGEASGGPMAQVAYPYYTTRGPRDFFLDNPPTIGR